MCDYEGRPPDSRAMDKTMCGLVHCFSPSWEASTWSYKSEAYFRKPYGTDKAMIATQILMTNEASIQRSNML